MQWMHMAIPHFQQLVEPLNDLLETAYEISGQRTSRAAAKISLESIGWSVEQLNMYENCKKALEISACLSIVNQVTNFASSRTLVTASGQEL